MGLGEAANSHQGRGHGNLGAFGKLCQLVGGLRCDHTAAAIDHRPLGRGNKAQHLLKRQIIRTAHGIVTAKADSLREDRMSCLVLDVLGNIDQHRPGTSTLGYMKGLLDDPGNIIDIPDKVAVLHNGKRHPKEIGLLESTATDHFLRHLSGDRNQRNRIHVGIGDAGHKIRGAGTGSCHADAGLTRYACISLGCESASLLMAGQDRTDLLRLGQSLMDGHRAATRIGKNYINTLALQRSDQNLSPIHDNATLVSGGSSFGCFSFLGWGFRGHGS